MKKIINGEKITIIFSNGETITKTINKESNDYSVVVFSNDEKEIKKIMKPIEQELIEAYQEQQAFLKKLQDSNYVQLEGTVFTIPEISKMSCPELLVRKIIEAEREQDANTLNSLLNFWKLCTYNPSEITRQNLFWFLKKNGMTITKNGLFVAYRNVQSKYKQFEDKEFQKTILNYFQKVTANKENPEDFDLYYNGYGYLVSKEDLVQEWFDENEVEIYEGITSEDDCPIVNKGNLAALYEKYWDYKLEANPENVYTDRYTQTMTIKIGEPVSMPRHLCDNDNQVTCSRGLHVASKHWLKENYFGDTGLVCLVNPAKVVAVPVQDDYGKMRVCEYFPVAFSERNEKGELTDTEWLKNADEQFAKYISHQEKEGKDSHFKIDFVIDPQKKVSVNDLLKLFS